MINNFLRLVEIFGINNLFLNFTFHERLYLQYSMFIVRIGSLSLARQRHRAHRASFLQFIEHSAQRAQYVLSECCYLDFVTRMHSGFDPLADIRIVGFYRLRCVTPPTMQLQTLAHYFFLLVYFSCAAERVSNIEDGSRFVRGT